MPKERQRPFREILDLPPSELDKLFFDIVSANAQKGEGPDYVPKGFPYGSSKAKHSIIHHTDGSIEFGPEVSHRTIPLDETIKIIFIQQDSNARCVRVDFVEDGFPPVSFEYGENGHNNVGRQTDEHGRDRTRIIKSETLGDGLNPHLLFSRPLSREEAGQLITALEDPERERDALLKLMKKSPQDRRRARRSLLLHV